MLNRVVHTVTTVSEKISVTDLSCWFYRTRNMGHITRPTQPLELKQSLNHNVRCLLHTASDTHTVDAGQVTWPWTNDPQAYV